MNETAHDRLREALARHGSRVEDKQPGRFMAQCPAHEDHNPSLHVTGIEGQALAHCFAGCSNDAILGALGWEPRDLFDDPQGAEYRYDDDRIVHRSPNKKFKQSGNLKGTPQLYRSRKVARAVADGVRVFLVEGEKDVHALESLGAVATTAPMGAGSFGKVDVAPLQGADVVAVVDNDIPGAKWAAKVTVKLDGTVKSLRFMEAAAGKDAADHIAAGHGLDDFIEHAVAVAPGSEPDRIVPEDEIVGDSLRVLKLTPASEIPPAPAIWAWEPGLNQGRIPAGALTLAAGREGTGKSSFGIWLAAELSRGTLPGSFEGTPRNVFYAAVEDSWSRTLVPRLMAAGADLDRVFRVDVEDKVRSIETMVSLPRDVDLIEDAIAEYEAAALIVDPLMSTLGTGTDSHREQDVRLALEPLVRMAERTTAITLGIAHFSKASGTDAAQLITGSGAFKNLARAALAFARDRETGEQVMSQVKNSLGSMDLPSLSYRIDGVDVDTPKGTANVGRLVFTGESERSVEDTLVSRDPEVASERGEAAEWIRDYLAHCGGSALAKDVIEAAAHADFKEDPIRKARAKVATTKRSGFGKGSTVTWSLIDSPIDAIDATPRELASMTSMTAPMELESPAYCKACGFEECKQRTGCPPVGVTDHAQEAIR